MKKYITRSFIAIFAAGLLLMAGATQKARAQDVMVSYQTFYDNLAPYGQWVYDPQYGNVWVPNEDGDFRPYGSRGHWVMTEYGNTWVSDDPWGWAVYHYGRWTYDPYYGWIWVPGYEWAPAWVSWRFGGGYAGWAPLGPGVSVGVSYYAPDSWWVFVGPQYMYQPNCIRYWNGPSYNTTYIRQTTIINNYYVDNSTRVRYNYGPRAEVVQQVTRRPVQVYRVNQLNRPGAPSVGRGTVSMYRPTVNRNTINDARPGRVIQAPQPIGRGQQVQQMGSGRQPAFRQEMMRQNADGRGGNRPGQDNRDNDRGNRNDNRPEPGRNDGRFGNDRGDSRAPGRFDNNDGGRGREDRRNDDRPQPGSFDRGREPVRNDNRGNDRQPDAAPQPGGGDNRRGGRFNADQPEQRRQEAPQRYDRRMDNRAQQPQQPQPQPQPQQPARGRQPEQAQPQPQPQPQQPMRGRQADPGQPQQGQPQQGGAPRGGRR